MSAKSAELEDERRRAARNQSLFREVNERIEDLATGTLVTFLCECMNERCNEEIQLSVQEYEKIRAHSTWFVVHVGHHVPGVETIVETKDRYAIVKKLGAGERVAEKLDPRRRH
jgi:3,4-dihydroxy-2-butanone 4-phosphate synthase